MGPQLCAPRPDTSCFACCPPIRKAGYDPLDFAGFLAREFRDNRLRFLRDGPSLRPIVGYSCWALGFIDDAYRRVGCLLHPCSNQGRDLRYLVGYADKCRRELCLQAQWFARLSVEARRFWLSVADGLNPFYFSSSRANPLMHLLLWGPKVLEDLARRATGLGWPATEILFRLPLLLHRPSNPKPLRYLLGLVLDRQPPSEIDPERIRTGFEQLRRLAVDIQPGFPPQASSNSDARVHHLPLDPDLSDFLRLALGCRRVSGERARTIGSMVEELARRLA